MQHHCCFSHIIVLMDFSEACAVYRQFTSATPLWSSMTTTIQNSDAFSVKIFDNKKNVLVVKI